MIQRLLICSERATGVSKLPTTASLAKIGPVTLGKILAAACSIGNPKLTMTKPTVVDDEHPMISETKWYFFSKLFRNKMLILPLQMLVKEA